MSKRKPSEADETGPFAPVAEAVKAIRNGEMVIVVDDRDIFLLKVKPDGTLAWDVTWGAVGDDDPGVYVLSGSPVLAGYAPSVGATGAGDAFVMEYDPTNGDVLWGQTWGGCDFDGFALIETGGAWYAAGITNSYEGALSACDCAAYSTDVAGTWTLEPGSIGTVTGMTYSPVFSSVVPPSIGGVGDDVLLMKLVPQTPGTSFCSSTPNSTCSPATMRASGSGSLAANDLILHASLVPNDNGIFYYGTTQAGGGAGLPFGNGLRCVGSPGNPVFRLPPVAAVGNELSYSIDNTVLPPGGAFVAGSAMHFQAWFRDPSVGANFDLSDGMTIVFVP